MSTDPLLDAIAEPTQKSVKKAGISSPPSPPKSQTIIVPTVSPNLIPDEDSTAYCFSRRNMFDIVIGLILAIGIIYFVMYTGPGGPGFTGFGSIFGKSSGTGVFGIAPSADAMAKPVTATGIGSGIGQLGGYLKKFFR